MFTVFAILRGIVTTFTKEGCAWDSGLVIVNMETLVISQSVSRIFIDEVPKLKLKVCLKLYICML